MRQMQRGARNEKVAMLWAAFSSDVNCGAARFQGILFL